MEITTKKSSIYLVIGFFLATILFDFLDKININNADVATIKLNRFSKLVFVLLSGLLCFFNFKLVKQQLIKLIIIAGLLVVIFTVVKPYSEDFLNYLIRYLFFFFVIAVFIIIKTKNLTNQLCSILFPLIDIFVVFNFLLIIYAFISNNNLFLTYNENRFGFNGLMLNQMQSPYMYMSFLAVLIYQKKTILFLITLFSCLMIGVKVLILGIFVFFLGYLLFIDKKHVIKKIIFLLVATLFVLFLFLNTPIFKRIIEQEGLLTALASIRDKHLIKVFSDISTTNFNVIFGCKDLSIFRCELEFVDVFLFFGLFGLIIYGVIMVNIYRECCDSRVSKIYFFTVTTMMFFAGNFFYFPVNTFIFMTCLFLLKTKEKEAYLSRSFLNIKTKFFK
ncbi:hypothetical protein SAMN04487987_102234 [Algibacter pectinivorans]|uniref:O-antigen ligase like membrane protein n=1 Tax=Algibacter pectinivorans TaxID=870482 RepID=A0A1I1NE60_9FLAO|nr:hypothetical protein SAMN04487987_102234 [Algibacter pectinivorans]